MTASTPRRAAVNLPPVDPAAHPSPVPGAGSPSGETAPGRGWATQAPAGGTHAAADVLPAGSRTYTITLPAGMKLLSLNGRGHWSERNKISQEWKTATWALARQAKIPPLGRISVVAEYQPPDRRRRDGDNFMPTVKACIDGIVDAGVIVDDESPRYVASITCRIGEPVLHGQLLLHVTEAAA